LDKLFRLKISILIDSRKVHHVHFTVGNRPGFAQRYAVPADVTVACVRGGDNCAIHFAENTGASKEAEAAAVALRMVNGNPIHLISLI
jgi:hypothetical protein